jgi:hypothetical protein
LEKVAKKFQNIYIIWKRWPKDSKILTLFRKSGQKIPKLFGKSGQKIPKYLHYLEKSGQKRFQNIDITWKKCPKDSKISTFIGKKWPKSLI